MNVKAKYVIPASRVEDVNAGFTASHLPFVTQGDIKGAHTTHEYTSAHVV